ncbi:MAG: alanine racemase [Gemmatimonadota bacterium]
MTTPPPTEPETVRTWVDVDLARIQDNVRALRSRLQDGADILVPVKADAYGHGLLPVARVLEGAGVWGLGIAALDEAEMLRKAGIETRLLCLMPILPAEAGRAVELGVTPAVTDRGQAEALAAVGRKAGLPVSVHVEVDTGMGRSGVRDDGAVALVLAIRELPGLEVDGMFTHFSSADEADRGHTDRQLARFEAVLSALAELGFRPRHVHVANSAAALRFRGAGRTLVRPGIAIYGAVDEIATDADDEGAVFDRQAFAPVLSWHARVVAVKRLHRGESVSYHRLYTAREEERIALLAVGYGDGLPLGLSNRGRVLLRGQRVPVRGAVCMDLTMVDATPFPDLTVGEVATLIGRQGATHRTVADVAGESGLSSYAVFTGITARVPRRYPKGVEG